MNKIVIIAAVIIITAVQQLCYRIKTNMFSFT